MRTFAVIFKRQRRIFYHRKFLKISPFFIFLLLLLCIVIILIIIQFKIDLCLRSPSASLLILLSSSSNISLNSTDEQLSNDHLWLWCQELQSHLDAEKTIPNSPQIHSPSMINYRFQSLPYHYSNWQSSSLLPRRFTPCEHMIAMRLLMIIDKICHEHGLTFAIADGTLLGSWRHHDIIPWDDDIDLMMPIEDQLSFLRALEQYKDTVLQYYLLEYPRNNFPYAKVFFQYKPFLVQTTWTFPFVDIFFYFTNKTHLWYTNDPDINMELKHVFPLMMRPLGSLWLPAPHKPQYRFQFDSQKECNSHWHDHRKERSQPYVKRNCSDLIDIYPFVQRQKSREVLKLNQTIIHTIIYSSLLY